MAAVTQNTSYPPTRHVLGDLVIRVFTVSGVSGSTLSTGMSGLVWAQNASFCLAGTASLITGLSFNAQTGVITFTSSNTMVNEIIMVLGRVG